ncbi:MAG TPA: MBL fold metallo-hydrolase [Candidatus Synoicihabitans sp.]|nr:MBL fold metallo-hydrolase [Candidatus Synoicihabitans sp.]
MTTTTSSRAALIRRRHPPRAGGRPYPHLRVTHDVHGLRTGLVNVFCIGHPVPGAAWVLIDGGLRGFASAIERAAARWFGPENPPRAILLTHGHFDHVGSLPALLRRWHVPVYAHAAELVHLNHRRPYPPPDPTVGGAMARMSVLFPRCSTPLPVRVRALPPNGEIPELPEWRWLPTPGHTPGHVSFWREYDRVLISGDAVITTRQEVARAVWHQTPEVRPPPAYFTPDWRAAYESIRRLRDLRHELIAPGHGLPMRAPGTQVALDRLVAHFPQSGLPRRGRYVARTWR